MYLKRANDQGFPFEGRFDYADLTVDQSTGTFMVRGIFDTPDSVIVPGLFVRIRIPVRQVENALLVPETALGSDQAGQYLLTVNSENKVERRNVEVGSKQGEMMVIAEGLQPDERVITSGILRARPGIVVEPELASLSMDDASVKTPMEIGSSEKEDSAGNDAREEESAE